MNGTGINESSLKTVSIYAKDIFGFAAVRLFYDRVIKLKMLYNNIAGEKIIYYINGQNFLANTLKLSVF
jgi:hypothetical protein